MLGIFGGTFDPVHFGHLRTALEVKESIGFTELRFIPCHIPPHRNQPQANSEQRLMMLKLALLDAETGFSIDRRELDREGPSYMVDTLASLREEVADRPICLILGYDAFASLPKWHCWRELFNLANLAIMRRPDSPDIAFDNELSEILLKRRVEKPTDLHDNPFGKIVFLNVSQLAISASLIRNIIAHGKSARYLLPDSVLDMIQTSGLYRTVKAEQSN